MRIAIGLLLVLSSCLINAQIDELPSFKNSVYFKEGRYEKNDTIRRNKIYSDNQPHVIYTTEGSSLVRTEFYPNGRLKSKSQIIQKIGIDTTHYFDFYSRKSKIIILKSLLDIPNGDYIDYHNVGITNKIKSKGKCKMYTRTGNWDFYERNGNKIEAYFNTEGDLDGLYKEYYFHPADSTYTIKVEGQFGIKNYDDNYKTKSGKIWTDSKKEIRRIGVWNYYSRDGTLKEITTHKWVK